MTGMIAMLIAFLVSAGFLFSYVRKASSWAPSLKDNLNPDDVLLAESVAVVLSQQARAETEKEN